MREEDEDERPDIDVPELRRFVESCWPQIRTFILRRPVQNVFNFYLNQNLGEMIEQAKELSKQVKDLK